MNSQNMDDIDRAILSVAILIDDRTQFRAKAREAALRLGPSAIDGLGNKLHEIPDAPPGFGAEERGLSGWISFWQFALFEILFNFGDAALPLLRAVAFRHYHC